MKRLAALTDLTPDPASANEGTERGTSVLDRSLERCGPGRGVVVDKHGVIIGGNHTVQLAVAKGFRMKLVQSHGERLIAGQRTDLHLGTDPLAREMGYLDNRTGELNRHWNAHQLLIDQEQGLPFSPLAFTPEELVALTAEASHATRVSVTFGSESELATWLAFVVDQNAEQLTAWVGAQVARLTEE